MAAKVSIARKAWFENAIDCPCRRLVRRRPVGGLARPPSDRDLERLRGGVRLEDGTTSPAQIQKLGDREELLGADVIVPHRMLKNHVIEQTGIKAYALFSQAAADALQLSELSQPLIPHTESYEHLGEVKMQVFDLAPVWESAQEQKRVFVNKEDAWIFLELVLPYPPTLIWEYLTKPDLEAGFLGYDYAERVDTLGGRVREDAGFHCAHGDLHVYSKILDWKPFEYYTLQQSALGISYICTRRLTPLENGTHLGVYLTKPLENSSDEVRQMLQSAVDNGYTGLHSYIQHDITNGKITAT